VPAIAAAGVGEPTLAWLAALPAPLWLAVPGLPAAAALIGFATTQTTVRRWLRQLP
jgi:cell division transport system permease protein